VALAGLMISELSAGCECRLFGTGLVMSENASDCTQNAAYRDRKLKDFLGRGAQPPPQTPQTPPHWRGEHPLPKRHPVARHDTRTFGVRPAAPLLSSFAPPHLTLLATGLGGRQVQKSHLRSASQCDVAAKRIYLIEKGRLSNFGWVIISSKRRKPRENLSRSRYPLIRLCEYKHGGARLTTQHAVDDIEQF